MLSSRYNDVLLPAGRLELRLSRNEERDKISTNSAAKVTEIETQLPISHYNRNDQCLSKKHINQNNCTTVGNQMKTAHKAQDKHRWWTVPTWTSVKWLKLPEVHNTNGHSSPSSKPLCLPGLLLFYSSDGLLLEEFSYEIIHSVKLNLHYASRDQLRHCWGPTRSVYITSWSNDSLTLGTHTQRQWHLSLYSQILDVLSTKITK